MGGEWLIVITFSSSELELIGSSRSGVVVGVSLLVLLWASKLSSTTTGLEGDSEENEDSTDQVFLDCQAHIG